MTGFDVSQGAPPRSRASSRAPPPSAPYYFTPPARLPHVSTFHTFYEAQAIASRTQQPRYRPVTPVNGVGSGVNALDRVVFNGGWRLNTDSEYLSFCERFPPFNTERQPVQRANDTSQPRPETPVPVHQANEAREPLPSESSPNTPIPSVQPSPVQPYRRRASTQRYHDFYTYQGQLAEAQVARQQAELRLNFNPWADTFRRVGGGSGSVEHVVDDQPAQDAEEAPEPVGSNTTSARSSVPGHSSTRYGGSLTPRQRPLELAGSRSTPYQERTRAASYHPAQGEERPPRPDTPIPGSIVVAAAAARDEAAYVQRFDTGDDLPRQHRWDREEGGGLDNDDNWFSLVLNVDSDADGNLVGGELQDMQEGRRESQVPSVSQSRRGSLLGGARPVLSRLMRMAVGQSEEEEPAVPLPPIDPHRPRPPNVHFPSQTGSISHNAANGPTGPSPHASSSLARPASPPPPRRGLVSRVVGTILQRQSSIRSHLWFPNRRRTGNLPPFPPPGQLSDFWGVPFPLFRAKLAAWNELNGSEKAWVTERVVDYVKTVPTDLRAKWAVEVLQEQRCMNVRRKVEDDFCAICQEGYLPRDPVTFGPCKHVFHRDCEKTWLKQKSTCPMCRRDFAALAVMADLMPFGAVIEAAPAWMST
ncbi:hypothetical protein IAT38_000501 [Cryptococcus sp. DSM 104549]